MLIGILPYSVSSGPSFTALIPEGVASFQPLLPTSSVSTVAAPTILTDNTTIRAAIKIADNFFIITNYLSL